MSDRLRYKVELQTSPSPGMEFYRGFVNVSIDADDVQEDGHGIFLAAVRELRRTAFKDRGPSCWKMLGFELI